MTQDTQVLFALLVYLSFFGWIGWRRGLRSELTVFVVALLGWVLLQERGNIFVRVTNLGIKFVALLGSSLATGELDENSLGTQPDFVQPGAEDTFLFLLWIVLLFGTYVLTSRPSFAKQSKKGAWAAVVGGLNGLLLLAVLLPKLNTLYAGSGGQIGEAPLQTFARLITQMVSYLVNSVRAFWEWVSPLSPISLLIVVTVLLAITALTLRNSAKAKG
jgi:hypothetical protein